MINITCNNKEVRSGTCADIGDSNVVAYISFFDTINNTERKLYQPVYGDFKTSTAYLFDLSGNSITLTYADSNKTRTELEDLLVDCCGCVGGDGTVTNFSAGNLSPLFTTNVATPTTTPALSFNLSNCNQYQVFGRVAAGTGAPSYVTLNPIAFNGLAIPNREVAFGNGTGITSTSNFQFTTGNSLKIGTGTVTGVYGINMGAGSNASNYVLNIGGGIVNNIGNYSLIICEGGSEISGSGSANMSVLIGGNNNKIIAGTSSYGNVIMGTNNTVTSTIVDTTYNRILGNYNTITDAYYNNISGGYNSISSSGAYSAYDNDIIGNNNNITTTVETSYGHKIIGSENTVDSGGYVKILGRYCNNGGYTGVMLLSDGGTSTLTATTSNQFNSRFVGGYRFMKDGSTQWMAISSSGYVTINNIPTAASATDILVSDSGVISKRTLSLSDFGGVPTSRTITINGNTQDLSANRTWTLNLDDINDVALTSPTNGQVLQFNGTNWINVSANSTISAPTNQIMYGTGTGWITNSKFIYNGTYLEVNNSTSQGVTQINSSNIIVGSNHSAGTYNSYLRLNATQSSYRATGISVYNFSSQDHWWFGTAYSSGNFYLRVGYLNDGDIWDACRDDGSATTNSVFFIPRTTTEFHVSNTLTVHNIPTAASATDILVSNGGVVSKRTVASLGIPVIMPAALTKTDDTNVTISLGGTPATALLQGVSLTMGWAGVLAISRGGTGLGSLGAANQLLRVNTGGTALEYFTPNWTSNTGTVTSVAASISGSAIVITGSPITTYGTLDFTWMGSIYQYVRGDGTLAYLPASANYLTDLLDVTITSPGTGQLLRYNGTEWVNWTPNFLTSNQTITLSGDVTGSGATSITTTIATNAVTTAKIANTAVTFAKIQNINTNRLLGRSSAGSGSVEEISIGSGLSLSGGTLSASGGGGSAVWKVQGGSTDATTNTQNIYHNANVWLGDGSSSSSSYRLQVSGTSYLTGSVTLNNITTIQAWNNAASQQLKIAQLDSSNVFNYAENYLKIVGAGGNAGDITISAYPHTRKDTLSAYPRNVLVTNSSGNLLSLPGECYKNDNVNTTLSSDESHSADSTWRTVTWDTVNTPSWSHYGKDTTSGNMKMKLPTSTYEYGTHLIFVTINYTGGTSSEVNAEIRINGSTVIGSATTNATASKNTLTFFAVVDNNATYQGLVISLHIMVATGTGSITVKSGSKMVMIAAGAPLPA